MKTLKLGLLSVALCSSLFAANYTVDTTNSNVGFSVKHMMVSNVNGKFKDITGSFVFDEKTNKLISLEGEIMVTSVDTSDEKRDNHLRADDILDAKKFPKIIFKSTKIEDDDVYGNITIKGVTKNIKLELDDFNTLGKKAGFSLEGKLNRSDFGVTWNKILETGGVAVSDEVKLNIDIQGNLSN